MNSSGNQLNSGRGSSRNPENRFHSTHYDPDPETTDREQPPEPDTEFITDHSKSILTRNNSPDVGFDVSLNPYRGCEHGCIYCYARPTHETLDFSAGLDFESKIVVKKDAPKLLREQLVEPSYDPEVIAMSGVTDPYQPVEEELKITRNCLSVLAETNHPVSLITKNDLVLRDLDHLQELADVNAVNVNVSVTTLDNELCGIMEPRTSRPHRRLQTIRTLSEHDIPVNVMVAPVIPGLTDHELPQILEAASEAGATSAGYVMLRLPHGVKDLFTNWLEEHLPEKKNKVLNRIREIRDGDLNDTEFHRRMRGEGMFADQVKQLFETGCRNAGLEQDRPSLETDAFQAPNRNSPQLSLF